MAEMLKGGPSAPLTYEAIRAAGERPMYEALDDTFIAPHMLLRGSTFRTWAPPAYIWKPLNEAAKQSFEVWYGEETIMLDDLGRKTKEKVKHHEKYRFKEYDPAEAADVEIVSGPPVQDARTVQSLAEVMYGGRRDTDPRPPPLPTRPVMGDDGAEIVEAKVKSISEKARERA